MNLLDVVYEWRDDVLIATMRGEIDMSNADELRTQLLERIPNRARGLVLEMAELTYIDSAGIHVVYDLRDDLSRRGQRLRMVVPDKSVVDETLRLADLDRAVGIRPSLDDALAEMPVTGSSDR